MDLVLARLKSGRQARILRQLGGVNPPILKGQESCRTEVFDVGASHTGIDDHPPSGDPGDCWGSGGLAQLQP